MERSKNWLIQTEKDLVKNDFKYQFYEWYCFASQQSTEKKTVQSLYCKKTNSRTNPCFNFKSRQIEEFKNLLTLCLMSYNIYYVNPAQLPTIPG